MERIWKFELEFKSPQVIDMPKGAIILDIQLQENSPCLWAIVNEFAEIEQRRFIFCTTGSRLLETEKNYIGTVQENNFVSHLFEVTGE